MTHLTPAHESQETCCTTTTSPRVIYHPWRSLMIHNDKGTSQPCYLKFRRIGVTITVSKLVSLNNFDQICCIRLKPVVWNRFVGPIVWNRLVAWAISAKRSKQQVSCVPLCSRVNPVTRRSKATKRFGNATLPCVSQSRSQVKQLRTDARDRTGQASTELYASGDFAGGEFYADKADANAKTN